MEDIAEIGFKARTDELVKAKKRLEDVEPAAKKAETASEKLERRMKRLSGESDMLGGRLGSVMNRLLGFAAAVGAALSIRQIAMYADAWSDMQSQIGAAIGNMDAAPAVMREMVRLANASYSPLQQTVESFARNVAVLRELGLTTQDQLDYTEALNHALVVTATRGERAASVQAALSRSMAVGAMQGDQLETVLVHGGRVAQALAEELGTTVSGLRQMATDGRITGAVIARALTSRLVELREEAAEMPATMTDAFVRIQTNLSALIGTFDQMTGASGTVATLMLTFADNLHMVAGFAIAAAIAFTISYIPAIWGAVTATLAWVAATVTLRGALIATGIGVFIVLIGTLIGKFIEIAQKTGSLGAAFELLGRVASGVWQGIVEMSAAIPLGLNATWLKIEAGFRGVVASLAGIWSEFLQWLAGSVGGIQTPFGNIDFAEMMGLDSAIASAERFSALQTSRGNMASSNAGIFTEAAGMRIAAGFETAQEALALLNVEVETLGTNGETSVNAVTNAANASGGAALTLLQRLQQQYSNLAEPINRARSAFDALQQAQSLGVITNSQYVAGLERIRLAFMATGGSAQQWESILSGATESVAEQINNLAIDSLSRLGDQFADLAVSGKASFSDLAKSIIRDLLRIMWQARVVEPFMRMLSGGGKTGGIGGFVARILGFAKGGTFGVEQFAKGGTFTNEIFNRPTPFKFAQGSGFGLGEMGEAGPEAVMPLTRGPDGSLGVQMYGAQGGDARAQQVELAITVKGEEGPMFIPTIRAESRDAAIAVTDERAPAIVSKSVSATRRAMNKSKSGWGI